MRRGATSTVVNPAKTVPHLAAAGEDISYSV
jgi:hypothetical protein